MILGGDEIGRTQRGNNNGYCQDNELSWFDWNLDGHAEALLAFTQRLTEFRQGHPVLRRRRWFQGLPIRRAGAADVEWFAEDGEVMTDEHWRRGFAKSMAVFLNGEAIQTRGPRGERLVDDSLLLLFNAHHETMEFTVPAARWGMEWTVVIDTADVDIEEGDRSYKPGDDVGASERSVVVLRRVR
jgi:glycogen operon protein